MKAKALDSENLSKISHLLKKLLFKKQRKSPGLFLGTLSASHQVLFHSPGSKMPSPLTSSNFLIRSNESNTTAQIKISLVG